MILATHALAGAALTHTYKNLVIAFFVSFVSHYFLDMIPHWHYHVPRIKKITRGHEVISIKDIDREILWEIGKISIDFLLGLTVSLVVFDGSGIAVLVGVFGAILPDLLAGLAKVLPLKPLMWHDKFHRWIHTDIILDGAPIIGTSTQFILALLFVGFF